MLHKIIDRQQEEEDISPLERDYNAVKINKLGAGEECGPLSPGLVVRGPLVTPGVPEEALSHAHAGSSHLARAELLDQSHDCAEDQRHSLK